MTRPPFWSAPWGFAQGSLITVGLLAVASALQVVAGHGPGLPVFPWSAICFGALLLAWFAGGWALRRSVVVREMAAMPVAICSMAGFFAMILVLAFVPQGGGMGWTHRLGMDRWLVTWPFILSALWLGTVLSFSLVVRLDKSTFKAAVMYAASHGGFLFVVLAMFFGAGDRERYRVSLVKGETVWSGHPAGEGAPGDPIPLPLAFSMEQFILEEYPPRLAIAEGDGSGDATWQGGQIEKGRVATMGPFQVTVEEVVNHGAPVGDHYLPMEDAGTTAACLVSVRLQKRGSSPSGSGLSNEQDFESRGWLATGSFKYAPEVMALPGNRWLALAPPEPRRFATSFAWWSPSGKKGRGLTELNHPATVDGWKVYQVDYDHKMGRRGETSVLEMVRDPWLPVVYLGIASLLLGAVGLIFSRVPPKEGS